MGEVAENQECCCTSLVVQWVRLCASSAEGAGLIPGGESKIPRGAWHNQGRKEE